MAAPKNNQFWKQRSKHGRDKLFASAALLWKAACEYFEWCDKNPWIKKEAIKSGAKTGKLVDIPTQRPYTLHGLCLYLGCSTSYFRAYKSTHTEEIYQDFLTVISTIEETIYNQKYEGAVVGAFNANIISRDLGLIDKVNTEHTGKDGAPIQSNTTVQHTVTFRRYGQGDKS